MKKVFFHFGPGGHAFFEKSLISQKQKLNYFDLSTLSEQPSDFSEILQFHYNYLKDNYNEPVDLYAHSFGCDIAVSLCATHPELIQKITLISPIKNIFNGLVNVCSKVASLEQDVELKGLIEKAKSNPNELSYLWSAILIAFQKESFLALFWSNEMTRKRWQNLQGKAPDFDFPYWQMFLNNYIKLNIDIYSQKIQRPCRAIIGENDPYYSDKDIVYWSKKVNTENLFVIKSASHSPHLDRGALESCE